MGLFYGTFMDRELLRSQLKRHEGTVLRPYLDSVGKLTIGTGRNLDDVGIFPDEEALMFKNDIDRFERDLNGVSEYLSLDPIRQTVIANMCFNLGFFGLMQFKRMWKNIGKHNYKGASKEMLDSKWSVQVGYRSIELAEIMRTGDVNGE